MRDVWLVVQVFGALLIFISLKGGMVGFLTIGLLGGALIYLGGQRWRNEKRKMECPYCKEKIFRDALKCKHCGAALTK
jgi:hypothetical protein